MNLRKDHQRIDMREHEHFFKDVLECEVTRSLWYANLNRTVVWDVERRPDFAQLAVRNGPFSEVLMRHSRLAYIVCRPPRLIEIRITNWWYLYPSSLCRY